MNSLDSMEGVPDEELDDETLEGSDSMIKLPEGHFRCRCRCNVFRKLKRDHSIFVCNACGEHYQSEK